MALVVGAAGVAVMPFAVYYAQHRRGVSILDAGYGVPLAFVLGVIAAGMARRAKRNLTWLRLDGRGTGVATIGVSLGLLAVALALMAALSIGFYEAVTYYQHHHG